MEQNTKAAIRWLRHLVAIAFVLATTCFSGLVHAQGAGASTGLAISLQSGQIATLLPDGRWLLSGGISGGAPSPRLSVYDTKSGATTPLTASLTNARSHHSATVMPDGTILFIGGVGPSGALETSAERLNLATGQSQVANSPGLIPRARHSATVLADGQVLLAGGIGVHGTAIAEAELFDSRTLSVQAGRLALVEPRYDHTATLLPNGAVAVSGGSRAPGVPAGANEWFDPATARFSADASYGQSVTADAAAAPVIVAVRPPADSRDAALDTYISVSFSRALEVTTLNAQTVTLLGPHGVVAVQVVPAEGGLVVFLNPAQPLLPDARYSVFVQGATDRTGKSIELAGFSFSTRALTRETAVPSAGGNTSGGGSSAVSAATAAATPNVGAPGNASVPAPSSARATPDNATAALMADEETWIPGERHLTGEWRTGRPESSHFRQPLLQAPAGVTALAGQVLHLDGKPARGVTLRAGGQSVQADAQGRVLLSNIAPGNHVLIIDGSTANKPGRTYGYFEAKVGVDAGKTTPLGYTIWMPRIHTEHAVRIDSPTRAETIVESPYIPGLQLRIPAGTIIRDRAGRIVTELSITPIPIDRPPFPLPTGYVPVYFTIQPGGGQLQGINPASAQGARLHYPNYRNEVAGKELDFWNYDPVDKGWYIYGHGRVSADRKQIVPNPGIAIYEFTGAMVSHPTNAPERKPRCDPDTPARDSDPVDCATGLFLHSRTDLRINDTIPLELRRTYRPLDTIKRAYGVGFNHDFDMFLIGSYRPWTYQDLILASGESVRFLRYSPGTDFSDAEYRYIGTNQRFTGATIKWRTTYIDLGFIAGVWDMRLPNGTVYTFPDSEGLLNARKAAPLSMKDRYGNTVKFTRDTSGNLTRIQSPNGRYIELTYNIAGLIEQARDHTGRTVTYEYDPQNRLKKVTNPEGGIEQYTYHASSGHMESVILPRGNTMVVNQYDANGRVIRQTLGGTDVYQFAYTVDGSGSVTQTDVTDPRGSVRRVTFNSQGLPLTDTYAFGTTLAQTYTYERDPQTNRVTLVTDPLGRKTRYTYDANGNRASVAQLADTADAVTETRTYNPDFNGVTSATNGLGKTIRYRYDTLGSLAEVEDPLGRVSRFSYFASGQLGQVTDAAGKVTAFGYEGGDPTFTTDPLGRTSRVEVDSLGRVVTKINPLGRRTTLEYDKLDRVKKIIDPMGGETTLAYDANDNMITFTDPRGSITRFEYDARDRQNRRIDPLLNAESFVYDGKGNLVEPTERSGKLTSFTYDALNRLSKAEYGRTRSRNGNLSNPDATVNYTYDAGNRPTQVVDTQGGTITRAYNGLNQITSETSPKGSVGYTYDLIGRRLTLAVTGQPTSTYGYDDLNALTRITRGSNEVGLSYDTVGRRQTLTLPNGIVATYTYDDAGQLTGIQYSRGGSALGDLTYAYDAAGQRIEMGGSFARMTLPPALGNAVYDAANRLTSWDGMAHTYDLNGNLTNDGSRAYTWDSRNRLSGITGGATATFKYDGTDRRYEKTVSGTATGFLYDGLNPVHEMTGTTTAVKASLMTGFGLDQFFARSDAAGTASMLSDALGSTIALTDANGAMTTQYTYEPYGKTTQNGEASESAFQYTGRENDGTGLYYYRARYYDPAKSRFIAEDPIGLAGGNNAFAYVNGNPLSYVDDLGLQATDGRPPRTGPLIFDPSAARADLARRMSRRSEDEKTYETYTRYNPLTGDCYTGRTSGYGSPEENVRQRGLQQTDLTAEGFLPPVLDRSSGNNSAIRGREQQVMDLNGGARSSGGSSRNLINGISPWNPRGPFEYIPAATAEFGTPVPAGRCTCQ